MTATDAVADNLSEEFKQFFLRHIPLGRMADPAHIAAAVVYFLGDESAATTGQLIDRVLLTAARISNVGDGLQPSRPSACMASPCVIQNQGPRSILPAGPCSIMRRDGEGGARRCIANR